MKSKHQKSKNMTALRRKIRRPMFWVQIVLSVIMPILTYLGLTLEDLNSWAKLVEVLFKAISNPYILGTTFVNVYNAITETTDIK